MVHAVNLKNRKLIVLVGLIALLFLAIPLFIKTPYYLGIFIKTFYIVAGSMAWYILSGMTGQFSLGHAMLMGMGAYMTTILQIHLNLSPWLGMLISMVVVGGIAVLVFYPCFVLRGPYFALASIALTEMVQNLLDNWKFVNMSNGITLPFGQDSFNLLRFTSKVPYYYIAFVLMILAVVFIQVLNRSRLGFAFKTIREDEDTAAAIGINVRKHKLIAVFLSTALITLCGTFYAMYYRFIDPEIMNTAYSVEFMLPAIIGGLEFTAGPLLGALILVPLSETLRALLGDVLTGINVIIYALAMILIIRIQPRGILGWLDEYKKRKKAKAAVRADLGAPEGEEGPAGELNTAAETAEDDSPDTPDGADAGKGAR